jgi:hypothetical protein
MMGRFGGSGFFATFFTGAGAGVTTTASGSTVTVTVAGGGASTPITISNKTGAYTVVASDAATIINCTSGSFTVALTAAATLGSGFNVTIWNTSTATADAITIDPAGAETIDGQTTIILRSGEGMQIVCNGTNWETGDKKTMRGYAENSFTTRPIASGNYSLALGGLNGVSSEATAIYSLAIYGSATSQRSTAIGLDSAASRATTATGTGAMALGGSYASGADSFSAAGQDNTSNYGARNASAIAIGKQANASGSKSVAIGYTAVASAGGAVAISSLGSGTGATASATAAVAIGDYAAASGTYSVAIGSVHFIYGPQASASGATAIGSGARAAQVGKYAYQGTDIFEGSVFIQGNQYGLLILGCRTTDATAKALQSDGINGVPAPSTLNQLILSNNCAFTFTGMIVARRDAASGTQSASWKIEGLIRREGTAASTVLVASAIDTISNVPAWAVALTADVTNGGLRVTVTGAAATNIRWVATIQTSEVIFA